METVDPEVPHVPVLQSTSGSVTPTSSFVQVLKADPTRIVLLLAIPSASTVVWALGATDGSGFQFQSPTGGFVELLWSKHGPIVQQAVYVLSGSLSGPVFWHALNQR